MNISEAVAKRIIELSCERDITINKLSTISALTQSTVDSIIKGKSKNPSLNTVRKICWGLDIKIYDFFKSPLFDNLDDD